MAGLVLFECVKLGKMYTNRKLFSKLFVCVWFTMCFWCVLYRQKIVPYGILVVGVNSRS